MRISTIIPAYNRAAVIGETLQAVLSQTRPPAEVIVVDDGSSDGTADLVAERFGKDVVLIRQSNAGPSVARNVGFTRSMGDIINFMDSDDVPSLNTYQVQGDAIEAGADMVYGPWLKTYIEGTRLFPEAMVMQAHPAADEGALPRLIVSADWFTVLQPCLFRRNVIEAAGPYRADLHTSEDSEMLYRILGKSRRVVHVAQSVLLYRVHPENQVSEQNVNRRVLDRADFWILCQRYAAARRDFSAVQRRMYRVRKIDVARAVRPLDGDRAAALEHDVTAIDRALHPIFKVSARARTKIRMMRYQNAYTKAFGAGRLTTGQREQIALLGYHLPESV